MREKFRIIGQVLTNRYQAPKPVTPQKEKLFDTLGGLVDFGNQSLSNEKSISTKLLSANTEWVYRNNDVIAKEVSKMEFELYSVGLKAGEIVYNEIETHPLLDLLDQFNSTTTKADALYITQSHKKLTGDSFWLLNRNGNQIQDIFILPPDKIELKLGNPTDSTADLVEGYVYKDVIDGKKIEQFYTRDDIIHIKTPNPSNPFRGYGCVEAAASVIDIDNLTNLTTLNFFKKGAITNFVLTTEGKLQDDQLKRLRAELNQEYKGATNAYKTMILAGGLKPENISFSNKDMEFLAQLQWYRDKIMVIFGNTPAALGIIEDVNRANSESTLLSWKRNTVKPEMDAIVGSLNEFLVPLYGKNLVLGYCDPVPEDRGAILEEVKILKEANVITTNEARDLLGYDPIQGEDELKQPVVPQNNQTNPQEVPKSLQGMNIKAILRKRGILLEKKVYNELKEAARPIAEKMIKGKKVKDAPKPQKYHSLTDEQALEYWQKQIHVVEIIEKRFEDSVQKFLHTVEKSFLNHLENEVSTKKAMKGVTKGWFDDNEADLIAEAQKIFTPLLLDQVIISGQEAYKLTGKTDPYIPDKIKEQIRANVDKFTASMLDTDKQYLTDIIVNGLQEGSSIDEIRTSITEKFADYSKMQAQRVTRTEVLRASNDAAIDAYEQSGVVEGKQWLTAGADDECAQFEGQIVTLKGNFYDSDSEFQDGDPPLHPNCRCVVLPVLVD